MRPQEKPWCLELHPETAYGLNMLIEKDMWCLSKVLTAPRDAIARCLDCQERDLWCQKGEANYTFLEKNDIKWEK